MKGLLITLVIVLGGLLAFSFFRSSSEDTRAEFDQQVIQEVVTQEPTPLPEQNIEKTAVVETQEPAIIIEPIENTKPTNTPLPASINHPVTFFPQAPDGDRNLPRQEACEEASIALANYFIKGKSLSRDQIRADILAMVDRQMELFGDYIHTSIAQTKELYLDFYGGSAYIIDNPSIQDIQQALADGHVVVAPFAGRKL